MIPAGWAKLTVNSHDEGILVEQLQSVGHPVQHIVGGWKVETGLNSEGTRHVVFLMDDGHHYGVKCAQVSPQGAMNEFTMWQIANLLQLPGAYAPGLIRDAASLEYMNTYTHQYYKDYTGPAAIVRWVDDGIDLFHCELNASRKRIVSTQIGEWWAFCSLVDLGDRHYGNFVYSEKQRIFAAIDMESPFHKYSMDCYYLHDTAKYVNANMKSVKTGVEKCVERIEQNMESIKDLIRQGNLVLDESRMNDRTPNRIRSSVSTKPEL